MAIRLATITPHFTVPDVIAASEYYRNVLGFEVDGFFGDPPVFTMVSRGPIQIYFNQDPSVAGKPRLRAPVAYDAYIHLTGLDELVDELHTRGATVVEGPVTRVYGMRELVVEDCHGLRIAFGEET